MSADPREIARERIESALRDKESRAEKAAAAIWAAVLINAGLGAVPLGINIWTFIGVSTVMVVALGQIHGYHLSNEGAGELIKEIFKAAGFQFLALGLGLKFFAEVLKGAGVITMGGATVAGMALDAVLCGAVTYALGYTTKAYFEKNRVMSKDELRQQFMSSYEEGKDKVKASKGG